MASEEYEVEKLLRHRPSERSPGTIEYLIKWKGYSSSENSWEREVNVFTKHMITEYWKKQKITKADYLKSINIKRKASDSDISTTVTPILKKKIKKAKKKHEKKSDTKDQETSKAFELTLEPPKGLSWSDLKKITNAYHSTKSGLFSQVKWSNGAETYIPNYVIREYQPSALIQYYETLLEFGLES